MGPNPWALALLVISWSVIAVTTVWCFYRMLTEGKRESKK